MIRKLTEEDRTQVLAYLQEEAAFNVFQIGESFHGARFRGHAAE